MTKSWGKTLFSADYTPYWSNMLLSETQKYRAFFLKVFLSLGEKCVLTQGKRYTLLQEMYQQGTSFSPGQRNRPKNPETFWNGINIWHHLKQVQIYLLVWNQDPAESCLSPTSAVIYTPVSKSILFTIKSAQCQVQGRLAHFQSRAMNNGLFLSSKRKAMQCRRQQLPKPFPSALCTSFSL